MCRSCTRRCKPSRRAPSPAKMKLHVRAQLQDVGRRLEQHLRAVGLGPRAPRRYDQGVAVSSRDTRRAAGGVVWRTPPGSPRQPTTASLSASACVGLGQLAPGEARCWSAPGRRARRPSPPSAAMYSSSPLSWPWLRPRTVSCMVTTSGSPSSACHRPRRARRQPVVDVRSGRSHRCGAPSRRRAPPAAGCPAAPPPPRCNGGPA